MPAFFRRDRAIEAALRRDEVTLSFQPQIEPRTGRVAGAEALARWSGAAGGTALFGRARRAGIAPRLSRMVQRKSIHAAASWSGVLSGLPLSINVLPEELLVSGYDHWLLGECAGAGLDPRRLTVEIVEDSLLCGERAAGAAAQLDRLRRDGVEIAIDDFGTGFSSLSYLTQFPVDTIKIDRGLIEGIARFERDRILVSGLVALARDMGLKVVIEGVESTAQLALLVAWDCDLYQGFQGAGPLDEVELARFVANAAAAAAA